MLASSPEMGYDTIEASQMSPTVQTISAIEPQQRNRDRMNLYLNGEFAMGINTAVDIKGAN